MKPVLYLQSDARWGSHDYSAPGENTTIRAEGCGIACTAMVIASLVDKKVTPVETAEWSKKHGYKAPHQGTYYSYFKPQGAAYGLNIRQLNGSNVYHRPGDAAHKQALDAIKTGNWVIACMGKGNWTTSGHYVLWYEMADGNVLINDPWSTKTPQRCAPYELFRNEVKYYWVVEIPDILKEEDDMSKIITQIATAAGCTEAETVARLGLLVKFQDPKLDAYQEAGVKKLQELGFITVGRDGRAQVNWGDLGVVIARLYDETK